jgi:hypothetical protein
MSNRQYNYFKPRRMASWWCTLEDILWPEKKIVDKIKRRAEGFARAGIDTAINFGFHTRFDYSDYFSSLHGYYANVCDELHKYGIKFMDHYSCNLIERPRNHDEVVKMHLTNRHSVLLHHDPIAAAHSQYAGHLFHDICEVDVRDGSRGYSWGYQTELFCRNNPGFLDMHRKYLERHKAEVPADGYEIDDMVYYGGLSTCTCQYCIERFKRDYGHELPPLGDASFWGDTSGEPHTWGNYENPVFRNWLRMRIDTISDHVRMIKTVIGEKPLMTCCACSGPISSNTGGIDLERMMEDLDLLMLENCGFSVDSINWGRMDALALHQKDIAEKMGNAPAVALSYTIYEIGGYMGWSLSRFWGACNWASTLTTRLEEDPPDAMEIHDIIEPINNWEIKHSDLDYTTGHDVCEVRLASNRYCRENGWHDDKGVEQWDRVSQWSDVLLEHNIGYRFIRGNELEDAGALKSENTPIILDGLGCVSDAQVSAIKEYLAGGGTAWVLLPFGTHDAKGFKRSVPISDNLLTGNYPGLVIIGSESRSQALERLIASGRIQPRLKQVSGDTRWSARLRVHKDGIVLHLMNRALEAVPHPVTKESESKIPALLDINSLSSSDQLEYIVDFSGIGKPWESAVVLSPELGDERRTVRLERVSGTCTKASVDLDGVKLYGVIQKS